MHNVTLTCSQVHTINNAMWELLSVYRDRERQANELDVDNSALAGYWKREAEKLYAAILESGIECGHTWEEQEQIESIRHLLGRG